jgi:carbon monoxide dehydrogenase subunit G
MLAIQIDHTIQAPASVVWLYLSDLNKFAEVHPIICKVDTYGGGAYRLYEKLPLGPFSFRFSYPVRVTLDSKESIIRYESTVLGIAQLDMRFHIVDRGDHSVTHEVVEIRSRLPVERYTAGECRKYHSMVFANMESEVLGKVHL